MRPLLALVIALVSAGALLAVASSALQAAPTADSIPFGAHTSLNPYKEDTWTLRPSVTFTHSGTLTGASLHLFTAIRDPSNYWVLQYGVRCGAVLVSGGDATVHAYGGGPEATIWATLPARSGYPASNVTKGATCRLEVTVLAGQPMSSLYWIADASYPFGQADFVVWGTEASSPVLPPSTGGIPPTAPSTDAPEEPVSAAGLSSELTAALYVGIGLLVVGLIVLVARR